MPLFGVHIYVHMYTGYIRQIQNNYSSLNVAVTKITCDLWPIHLTRTMKASNDLTFFRSNIHVLLAFERSRKPLNFEHTEKLGGLPDP